MIAPEETEKSAATLQIASWKFIRQLGKGGMAAVYEVEDTRLGTRAALKLFSCPKDSDGDVRARFLDEDWRRALVAAATEHVFTKTALSDRDRAVYRQFRQEERPLEEVARAFGLSRNNVSNICSRIDQRIVAVGREMANLAENI